MDNNLPLHIKKFNDRVRTMNQTNGKLVTLNAEEARSLHAEIYDLMATISHLSKNTDTNEVTQINMDGGGFK
jgi:phosphosulfolactate phosphohydrolase-like enzyme